MKWSLWTMALMFSAGLVHAGVDGGVYCEPQPAHLLLADLPRLLPLNPQIAIHPSAIPAGASLELLEDGAPGGAGVKRMVKPADVKLPANVEIIELISLHLDHLYSLVLTQDGNVIGEPIGEFRATTPELTSLPNTPRITFARVQWEQIAGVAYSPSCGGNVELGVAFAEPVDDSQLMDLLVRPVADGGALDPMTDAVAVRVPAMTWPQMIIVSLDPLPNGDDVFVQARFVDWAGRTSEWSDAQSTFHNNRGFDDFVDGCTDCDDVGESDTCSQTGSSPWALMGLLALLVRRRHSQPTAPSEG